MDIEEVELLMDDPRESKVDGIVEEYLIDRGGLDFSLEVHIRKNRVCMMFEKEWDKDLRDEEAFFLLLLWSESISFFEGKFSGD